MINSINPATDHVKLAFDQNPISSQMILFCALSAISPLKYLIDDLIADLIVGYFVNLVKV